MAFSGEFLRRVLILPEAGNTGAVKLLAVELYDDGLIVRWMRRASAPPLALGSDDPVLGPGSGISVADDRGTEYVLDNLSAGATQGSFHGQTVFTPAMPAGARVLRVAYAGEAEVAARLNGGREAG